ncbi:MAG: hypothetical protein NUW00_02205 [Candidatus Kaiserbacteria bacterium]|nr:hypothetical protein [Candidatus Kaiserbacteria bacterium]
MKFLASQKGKFFSSIIAGFLTLSFILAPISQNLETRKVEAAVDYETLNTWWNGLSAGSGGVSAIANSAAAKAQGWLVFKEFTLDGIAWMLINITIQEMIRSTTRWVASGFKGSPAFVTDLQGFLLNIADKVAGNFIYGSNLAFLCSPFKLNIQLALDLSYERTRGYEAQCRLSRVVGNMDRFLNGDFSQGGWDGWFEVAMTDSNPYATKLEAESAMYASIGSAQGIQTKKLDFGKGFLSVQDPSCNVDMGPCPDVTPGAAVESLVNSTLQLPAQRLNVAKEINELVGTLLTQLGKEVLSGAGGLLGLTDSSYGDGNYWSRVDADTSAVGYVGNSQPIFESTLENENRFITLNTTIVDMVNAVRGYREAMYPVRTYTDPDTGRTVTTTPCASGELTPSLERALTTAQRNIASTTVLVAELTLLQTDYNAVQNVSIASTTLRTLMRTYNGNSVPDTKSKILDRYLQYESSGRLHDATTLVNLELQTIRSLGDEITAFKSSIDNACRNYNDNNSNGR